MRYLAWFSAGITSAVACKMAIEAYGAENVDIVYIKIDSAHEDNSRFIADCEKWYGKSIEVVQSAKYRDQFEVIKRGYINGPTGAPCTLHLKKEVRAMVEKAKNFPPQVFGFEFSKKEVNRAIRFAQQHPHTKPAFPLIDRRVTKRQCAELLLLSGIELPEMYKLGFHNNNCIGCVKGGKGYWNMIRKHFPEIFERMALAEEEVGATCIKGKALRDLAEDEGKHEPPILPDCGTFCEIEFADVIDPITEDVIAGRKSMGQLTLF